jgi:hypothetical protein
VTRTWETADDCGNVRTHTQTITVLNPLEIQGSKFEGYHSRLELRPGASGSKSKLRTSNFKLQTSNFELFPNPTTDRIRIDLSDFAGEAVTISIFSDLGQLVWENRIPAVADLSISVSLREAGAAAGMYTVRVQNNVGVISKRLLLVE